MKRELKPLHLQKPPPSELQTGQIVPASYLVWEPFSMPARTCWHCRRIGSTAPNGNERPNCCSAKRTWQRSARTA